MLLRIIILAIALTTAARSEGQTTQINLPISSLESERTLAWIFNEINSLNRDQGFSGTFFIASNGTPLFNYASGTHQHIDSLHSTGTNNIMFAVIAIAILRDQEKIQYSDPLSKHLTEFKTNDSLLVSHILAGLSGFNSRLNFKILYTLIEKQSGVRYKDFLHEYIFKAGKMNSTRLFNTEDQAKQDNVDAYREVYSNVGDLNRFHTALYSNQLISEESRLELTSNLVQDKTIPGIRSGYGFDLYEIQENHAVVVRSSADNNLFDYFYFPELNRTLIMFCDPSAEAYKNIKQKLLKLIIEN